VVVAVMVATIFPFVDPPDRQDSLQNHISHHHLLHRNHRQPCILCTYLKKRGTKTCLSFWEVCRLWLGRIITIMVITPSCHIFSEPSIPVLAKQQILWKQMIGYEQLRRSCKLLAPKILTRFCLLVIIWKNWLLSGGIILRLCGLLKTRSPRRNSKTNVASIIFPSAS
jgi:hypothetical protein